MFIYLYIYIEWYITSFYLEYFTWFIPELLFDTWNENFQRLAEFIS